MIFLIAVVFFFFFDPKYFQWAANLSTNLIVINNEERTRRKQFMEAFDRHFIKALFTGLDDDPPEFATKPPTVCDSRLPNFSKSGMTK